MRGRQSSMFQAVERRVKRTLVHRQHVFRHLLDAFGDRPAVQRTEGQRLENQQVERALEEIDVRVGGHASSR